MPGGAATPEGSCLDQHVAPFPLPLSLPAPVLGSLPSLVLAPLKERGLWGRSHLRAGMALPGNHTGVPAAQSTASASSVSLEWAVFLQGLNVGVLGTLSPLVNGD